MVSQLFVFKTDLLKKNLCEHLKSANDIFQLHLSKFFLKSQMYNFLRKKKMRPIRDGVTAFLVILSTQIILIESASI